MSNILQELRKERKEKQARIKPLQERRNELISQREKYVKMLTQHSAPMRYVKFWRLVDPIDQELRELSSKIEAIWYGWEEKKE